MISGNGTGIRASGGAQAVGIANNLIGTNAAGTATIPNSLRASCSRRSNLGRGVFLNGGPNRLEGNCIGLLPNLSPG